MVNSGTSCAGKIFETQGSSVYNELNFSVYIEVYACLYHRANFLIYQLRKLFSNAFDLVNGETLKFLCHYSGFIIALLIKSKICMVRIDEPMVKCGTNDKYEYTFIV